MEKLKNLLNPGSKYDEEVLYGSGGTENQAASGTSNTTSAPGGSALSDTTNQRPLPHSDVGSTTAIRDGVPGATSGSGLAGSSESSGLTGNSYPDRSVGSTTGKPSTSEKIREIGSGLGGNSGTETADPNTSRSYGSNLGRDAALGGAAAGGAGLLEQGRHHELGETASTTTGTRSRAGVLESGHHRGLGDSTGITSGTGAGLPGDEDSWEHSHTGHAHEFAGDPCGDGTQPAGPHFIPGPHATDTANRLDPHVGTTGQGHHHPARDTSLAGGAGTAAYEADQSRGTTTSAIDPLTTSSQDPTTSSGSGSGIGSLTGHHQGRDAALTGGMGAGAYESGSSRGPTSSAVDPLDSSSRDPTNTSDTRLGSTSEHHAGRDAALAGGLGTAAYEADRRHGSTASGAGRHGSTASGMNLGMDPGASETHHKSGVLNTLDPRVAQDTTSTAAYAATEDPAARDSHGREARVADASGMQGHRVVVPYEPDAPPLYKHDGGAYTDEEKYGKKGAAERKASAAGLGAADTTTSEKERKPSIFSRLDPRKKHTTSETNDVQGVEDPAVTGRSGQTYQSADVGGMQGSRVAVPHESNAAPLYKHDGRAYTDEEKYGAAAAGAGAAGVGAYEAEKHHHGREQTSAVPAAGAGEFSKKEAEKEAKREQKELAHEEKLHEKEMAKQENMHEKALAKEEKHQEKEHEKALAKEEKDHEKVLAKDEKHHEKAVAKEEKHGEKKHGFLHKLLHREKTDDELREEEAERHASSQHGITGARPAELGAAGAAGAGAGAVGINEHEKHERNRLHKDPPESLTGGSTTYADAPTSGYASQVTGGTGTTALAQGDSIPAGSHATGMGNTLDPSVATRGENVDPSVTTSPQSGKIRHPEQEVRSTDDTVNTANTSSVAGHPGDFSGPAEDPIMERVQNFRPMGHFEEGGR